MEIVVVTLFESMFEGVLGESILKRAQDAGLVQFRFVNFRDFALDKHRTVDDAPFGGGPGLVLKPQPLFDAMSSLPPDLGPDLEVRVALTPQGEPFTQELAQAWSKLRRIVLVCGHYEGFDERILRGLHLKEVSLGDFVLTGGEIPAMAVMDAVTRLVPGVLGNTASPEDDSFTDGLLEYPQFTRPASFRGLDVPPVLLSGNHAEVARWRRRHALYRTWVRRPDLLQHASLSADDRRWLSEFEAGHLDGIDVLEAPAWRKKSET
ncbi:MAG: tRNA (guanosine(37)-N1)-methyltransferase TrmD [Alicyclobacillus sp.]|nr:tRNA (guanosine(37)-N1)-methyltransferase TrmD [Alicyclobacillus sp.]